MATRGRKDRKKSGEPLVRTPKVGTPIEDRAVPMIFDPSKNLNQAVHPSGRVIARREKQRKARDA